MFAVLQTLGKAAQGGLQVLIPSLLDPCSVAVEQHLLQLSETWNFNQINAKLLRVVHTQTCFENASGN